LDKPIAIACFGFFTFLPLRPLFNSPRFISCISSFTYRPALGLYLRPRLESDFLRLADFADAVLRARLLLFVARERPAADLAFAEVAPRRDFAVVLRLDPAVVLRFAAVLRPVDLLEREDTRFLVREFELRERVAAINCCLLDCLPLICSRTFCAPPEVAVKPFGFLYCCTENAIAFAEICKAKWRRAC
jgi:hypothetical protein